MNKRHDERYQKAKARITPARRKDVEVRVLKAFSLEKYPTEVNDIVRVDNEVDHRLGLRPADRRHKTTK